MTVDLGRFRELQPHHLWFLGLMAADGCISDRGIVSLGQSGLDGLERLAHAAHVIGVEKLNDTQPPRGETAYSFAFTDRPFVSLLAQFGIVPRKSLTLEYPSILTENQHAPFIAGYIDGDGCVGIYNRHLIVSLVGTESFTHRVNKILPVSGCFTKIKSCKNCWDIRWNGRNAIEIGRYIWGSHVEGFKRTPWEVFCQSKIARQHEIRDAIKQRKQFWSRPGVSENSVCRSARILRDHLENEDRQVELGQKYIGIHFELNPIKSMAA